MNLAALPTSSFIVHLVSVSVGVTLLLGASIKARDMEAFRLASGGYPGAARFGVAAVSNLFVGSEFVSGALIVAPDPYCSRVGLACGILLTFVATMAVALRWRRGERRFRCGCGTDLNADSSAHILLARNVLFILTLSAAAATTNDGPSDVWELSQQYLTAIGIVVSVHLLASARLTRTRIMEWTGDA
jgi:hypothetical protein